LLGAIPLDKPDFELYAREKRFGYSIAQPWEKLITESFSRYGESLGNVRILDYGCGDGKYFHFYVQKGLIKENIFGVEISKTRVERCRNLGWDKVFHLEDGKMLPFPNEFFDVVNMTEVIEHIPRPDTQACLGEIHRVLNASGCMIISTPNYPIKRVYDIVDAFFSQKWDRLRDDQTHVTYYNHKTLKETIGRFFSGIEMHPFKEGFLYKRYRKDFLMHKIIALCTDKR
jgi:SAM-dependent methyltransferase